MERPPDYIIDVKGIFSPFTLLKISRVFKGMAPGDTLEIRECDPETRSDLLRILPPETRRLGIDDAGGEGAAARCRIRVSKTAVPERTPPVEHPTPSQKGPIR
ncbi:MULTISPECIES: sulfurtransferase TusA family protein [Desulfococcus]|jgi:TusA-related sulfurtransferase|uniref:SirA-like domain-containing protein n=1 Tax=Desulfococcus multivorans DSM 2059 TaxID=1121405 RepID=S7TPP5_DESML|nr:hypothetical protein [Desulfococcus multivorans]AOY60266.1 uncharacterized protein Dmul_34970 [Desulfococcus multivorans]AQV02377.1 hypothetical protein B2D07_17465 [Desulfococcus multivorans]EPR39192.1 hypothetical protein dsmv_2696 [Desulfococcus multivorans DSM 2059]MDX9819965.1 hypothetical protein [Desulfococcus multivorans]SJZ57269.1 TusA-related sulfurtransferase [Desulfococcus multivorans DSM 2059]